MGTIDDFIKNFDIMNTDGVSLITSTDLDLLRDQGISVELFFQYLADCYDVLLHGSQVYIRQSSLRSKRAETFTSDLAPIALMRAVVSNEGLEDPGLDYPYFPNSDFPLELRIHGIQPHTMTESGFVYVIPKRQGFQNNPEGSWQYISSANLVPFCAMVEVLRTDFKYPIYDVTNDRVIQ